MILRHITGVLYSSTRGKEHGFIRNRRLHVPSVKELESFGTYTPILPPEPYIEGVAHIPMKRVPELINRPPYASGTPKEIIVKASDPFAGDPYEGDGRIVLGSNDETKLRRATKLAKSVLYRTKEWVKVGTTTEQLDATIHDFIISSGAYPSPLGYAGFPKACCTSVNNVIAHGIPDELAEPGSNESSVTHFHASRPLENGDIVNVDITVYLDGFHGDTSQTFLVGAVVRTTSRSPGTIIPDMPVIQDRPGTDLVHTTNLALKASIEACGPNRPFLIIGRMIHEIATQRGYSVNSQFTGHGIGRVFHRPPWIFHHKNNEPGVMLPGHVFTIEPSLVQGNEARGWMFPDGWTVATESGARSAQAEHTVLITDTGVDILT